MKTTRVTSRRAKTESKKLFIQTILMLFASIVIIIVFLFLVLPILLKFISGQGGDNILTDNQIPPQVPTISTPVTATNSAQLSISGFSEKNLVVYTILNGQEYNNVRVDSDDGKFETMVDLQEGENSLKFFAENDSFFYRIDIIRMNCYMYRYIFFIDIQFFNKRNGLAERNITSSELVMYAFYMRI